MTLPQIAALTARLAALWLDQSPARYHLSAPRAWRLHRGGRIVSEGVAHDLLLVLPDLIPASDYLLAQDGREDFAFRTPPCAGAVDPRDFGARPDQADTPEVAQVNAAAFARAIAALPKGGTLLVPKGRWVCAPLLLRSDMVFHLQEGAEIFAPTDRQAWPILPAQDASGRMLGSWEGLPEACHAGCVYAIDAQNLTICGSGRLDGGGDRGDWWSWPKETRNGARRPRGLHLINCEDVALIGFEIRNAPSWTIHPQGCKRLSAVGLRILAPHDSPNTDGFNPEICEDVEILGTRFSVGDDCIAIKAGKRGPNGEAAHLGPTQRITIAHCLMERGHGGLVIGSEMSGDVREITLRDCEMRGTDRGLRLKTRRGRGGRIDAISLRNVVMDRVSTAFSANAHYHCDSDGHSAWVQDRAPKPCSELTPQIGKIEISDVEIHNLAHALGAFMGLSEAPIGPISIQGVVVRSYDPQAVAAAPLMADGIAAQRHAGVLIEHATLLGMSPDPRPITQPQSRTAKDPAP